MKKFLVLLAVMFLFAAPSFAGTGGFMDEKVQDAALNYIATNGTVWSFVTSITGPITYSQANTAYTSGDSGATGRAIAKVTVAGGAGNGSAGNGGYAAIGAGAVSGRSLDMLGVTGMTTGTGELLANGTATHVCILYPAASADDQVVACNPLTANKTIADYTTEIWDWTALNDAIELRAYTTSQ